MIESIFPSILDKKAKGLLLKTYPVFVLSFLALLSYFVFAAHVITTSSGGNSINVREDVGFVYNISVNISDSGQDANVTQVNITLPSGFLFVPGSENGTTVVNYSFSNTSDVLTWENLTYFLINGSDGDVLNYFWFNATISTPGNYNISVVTLNGSGVSYSNISVVVNDTTVPSVTGIYPAAGTNYSISSLSFNISVSDNVNVSQCWFTLNSGTTNYTMTLNSSLTGANYTNSSIGEALYTAKYYCNDTSANVNGTTNVTFRIDTTAPTISLSSPSNGAEADSTENFTFTPTDTSGIASCTLYVDGDAGSSLSNLISGSTYGIEDSNAAGSHTWSVNCTDSAGNIGNSTNRSFTVPSSSSSSSGSGGGGGGAITTTWKSTYNYNDKEFSEKAPLTRDLFDDYRVRLKIEGEDHHVGVTSLSATTATIQVASSPQTATLRVGEEKKFEVTNDTYYDILVKLNNVTTTKANLTISYIHELMPATQAPQQTREAAEGTGEQVAGTTEAEEMSETASGRGKKVVYWILSILGIAVLAYFGYLFYRKRKRGY